jgi:hypothetical protein
VRKTQKTVREKKGQDLFETTGTGKKGGGRRTEDEGECGGVVETLGSFGVFGCL